MAIFGLHDFFLIVTILFSLALGSLSLLSGVKNPLSSRFMALFFFALAVSSSGRLIVWNPYFDSFTHAYSCAITFLYVASSLLIGPGLYLYVRSLTQPRFRLNAFHSAHFIAPLLVAIGVYLSRGGVDHITRVANPSSVLLYWAVAILGLAPLGYTLLSWAEVKQSKKMLRDFYASSVDIGSKWLPLLVCGYFLVLLASLLIHFYSIFLMRGEAGVPRCFHSTIDMLTFGLLFVLFFYSWSREAKKLAAAIPEEPPVAPIRPDEILNLPAIEADAVITDLTRLEDQVLNQGIFEKKLHLDSSLNIERFAMRLNLKPKEVSFFINSKLQQNFFEFINHYRIQEAKRLLLESQNQSVNDIMLQSGYSSTSSFFRAFKKITGVSPSQFRNNFEANAGLAA